MKTERLVGRLIVALALAGLAGSVWVGQRRGLDLKGFGSLPALHAGRVKPLDTIARSSLLTLSGRQTLKFDGREISATEWLLDAAARPELADRYKAFVIEDPDLLGLLGRERISGKSFSFLDLAPRLEQIQAQAARAAALEAPQRSRFEAAAVNLWERVEIYQRIKNTFQVEGTQDLYKEIKAYQRILPAGLKALGAHQKAAPHDRKSLAELNFHFERYRFVSDAAYFRPLPPLEEEQAEGFSDAGDGLLRMMRQEPPHPAVLAYAELLRAYQHADGKMFHSVMAAYKRWLHSHIPKTSAWAAYESAFNGAEPFYRGLFLYLGSLLLLFASWLVWPETLRRSALQILMIAFLIHTLGLAFRVILQGRPPVTNLYSSAVFVGWAGVALGIALERLYRKGFGIVAASAIGFTTLIIAHHLAAQGDTVEMMRAVLDSNFWLATHVVTITIGYSSMFLASALAHLHIFRRLLSASWDEAQARSLASMTYGVICFSLFFSFLGTVLGGIWAEQSWGRFWGWDPKENGALLIVLWNVLILHARWGGYVGERGVMLAAVFGGVITALSWFGVNMLGIGLHSYGFMDKAFYALSGFVCTQLAVIALGSLPTARDA